MDKVSLAQLLRGPGRPHEELASAYRGALLGAACGNVLGIGVEFRSAAQIKERHPSGVREIPAAEKENPWDDDLAQTALVAEALLANERGELDLNDLAERLLEWRRKNGRGIGGLTRNVLDRLAAGDPPRSAARLGWEDSGRNNAGNGAVMRCSPIALRWRTDARKLIEEATKCALITHYDWRCVWSTVTVTSVLACILNGSQPTVSEIAAAMETEGADAETVAWIRSAKGISIDQLRLDERDAIGYTLRAMHVGLWAHQQDGDFADVVASVIEAGGDTDTNGIVAGAIVGARVGEQALPKEWLTNIRGTETLRFYADGLFRATPEGSIEAGDMSRIKSAFDETFESWSVELPETDIAEAKAGALRQKDGSGLIRYAFGHSERGEYLEFYAFHRIWGDGHQRIYASGEVDHLATLETILMVSDDPAEMKRRQEEQEERNQQLLEDLDRAGLREGGPVPGSFEINAHLVTGGSDPQSPED
ncbi:MAG TPA: ADP-ribosylglycohydrolase family protein [Actinomycetota bacterium]|nr:ADP-ribosylglycohydrolase family protein [Actinomycetota bacterium]